MQVLCIEAAYLREIARTRALRHLHDVSHLVLVGHEAQPAYEWQLVGPGPRDRQPVRLAHLSVEGAVAFWEQKKVRQLNSFLERAKKKMLHWHLLHDECEMSSFSPETHPF